LSVVYSLYSSVIIPWITRRVTGIQIEWTDTLPLIVMYHTKYTKTHSCWISNQSLSQIIKSHMYNNSANVINTYYLLNLTSFVLSTECNLFILNDTEIIMKIYLGTSFLFRQICHFYPIKLFVSIALNCWLLNYLIITSFIESSSTTSLQNGHLRSSSEMFSYF